jgi:hypothetical protein
LYIKAEIINLLNALKDVLECVLYFDGDDDDHYAPTYNDDRRRPTTDQGFGIDMVYGISSRNGILDMFYVITCYER